MSDLEDDDIIRRDEYVISRLTPTQKKRVYEEEKQRLAGNGPLFSTKTKIFIGLYIFGCTMMYFGIPQSTIKFIGSWKWEYNSESDILWSLLNAAIELSRPLLAVIICGWILVFLSIPVGLCWELRDFFSGLKKFFR